MNAIIPIPRIAISIRPGTMDDLAFIDALQKKNNKQVGFLHRATLEGKIRLGHVLVAWASCPCGTGETPVLQEERVGYLIGNDQYFKHDDIGIIYQINIAEGKRRGLVGAMLLKAQFERSAYGCKLYCCWCAQDIEANQFWEAMGFVPLAFRTGSEKKSRVHIFWQKRIRSGDTTTPWWFPSQTTGGSIREDRLVLPIPPGKSWSDEMPRILPGGVGASPTKMIENKRGRGAHATEKIANPPVARALGGWGFTPPAPVKPAKAAREKKPKPKVKNDPKLVSAARELRDRWLEKVNENPALLGSPVSSTGKYEVSRSLSIESPDAKQPALMIEGSAIAA